MATALEIVKEVLKENGVEAIELVAAKAINILEELGPKLILADDTAGKVIGTGLSLVVPAVKPILEKLADINKDGRLG